MDKDYEVNTSIYSHGIWIYLKHGFILILIFMELFPCYYSFLPVSEAYLELSRISVLELFEKIVNN